MTLYLLPAPLFLLERVYLLNLLTLVFYFYPLYYFSSSGYGDVKRFPIDCIIRGVIELNIIGSGSSILRVYHLPLEVEDFYSSGSSNSS